MKTSIFQKLAATFIVACMFTQLFIPKTHAQEVLDTADENRIIAALGSRPTESRVEIPNFGVVAGNTTLIVGLHIAMGTANFMTYLESYAPSLHTLVNEAVDLSTADGYAEAITPWDDETEFALLTRKYLSIYKNTINGLPQALNDELRLLGSKATECITTRTQKIELSILTKSYGSYVSQQNRESAKEALMDIDAFVENVCESGGNTRAVFAADQCAVEIESITNEIHRATAYNLTAEVAKLNTTLQALIDTECSQEVLRPSTQELNKQLAEVRRQELRPAILDKEPEDNTPVLPNRNLCDAGTTETSERDNLNRFATTILNQETPDLEALQTRIQSLSNQFAAEDVRHILVSRIDTMIDLVIDAQERDLVATTNYLCNEEITRRDLEPRPVEISYAPLESALESATIAVTNVLLGNLTDSRDLQTFTTEVSNMVDSMHGDYEPDVKNYLTLVTTGDYNLTQSTATELLQNLYGTYTANITFHSTISIRDGRGANITAYRQGTEIAVATVLFTDDTYTTKIPDGDYTTSVDFGFNINRGAVASITGKDEPNVTTTHTQDRVTDFTIPQEFKDLIENGGAPVK